MNITLFNSTAEKNVVNKNSYLSRIISMGGTLRERCSVSNPSILIELDATSLQQSILKKIYVVDDNSRYATTNGTIKLIYDLIAEILTTNYVYIKEFDRYYFVTDIISEGRNLWRINMRVDVLMSFIGELRELNCFVSRNEFQYEPFIQDDLTNFLYNKEIEYKTITNLSTVKTLSTNPAVTSNTCVIAYMTDDAIKFSASTPALNNLPIITEYASGGNISTQYMTGTTGILYDLAKAVYKNDTLLSFIKNVMVYPFDITSISDATVSTIKIGTTDYVLTDTFKYPQNYPDRILIAHFKIDDAESFLDYSPYKLYEIYIPYYGYVSLSGEAILGHELKIFYYVNYEDGSATAFIYDVTFNKVIFSSACVLGVRIPLSSSNALELKNQKTALALNTGINLIGSVIGIAGGVASGDVYTTSRGIMGATSTLGNAVSTYNQLYDLGDVGIVSGSDGLSNMQSVHIKITKSIPLDYDDNYFKLKGRPYNYYVQLKYLNGFTVCSDFHLEGFKTANDGELNEIDSLLKQGIIL